MTRTTLLPIESLQRQLRRRFSDATIELDRPKKRSGIWYLDITRAAHLVIIQWQEGKGFGITSSSEHAYGDGADEVYPDEEATYCRTVSLLLSGAYTSPPAPLRLSELRKAQGISQTELAVILNKQQGEISKIERRQDVKLSTLRDYISSIGGTLQVLARMSDGKVRAIEIEVDKKKLPGKNAVAG